MLAQDPEGNLVLTVSNQSFAVNPVDIRVTIDGEVAVDEAFEVGEGQPAGHGWKQFRLRLGAGAHRLRAVSGRGEAELDVEFEVVADDAVGDDDRQASGKHYALLMYWCSSAPEDDDARFTLQLADQPISFM